MVKRFGPHHLDTSSASVDGQVLTYIAAQHKYGPVVLGSTRVINAQANTAYTLALTDANRTAFLTLANANAVTVTVPANATVAFPVGAVIEGAQTGAGQVTLAPANGVTISATPGSKVAAQYGTFRLIQLAIDSWLASGQLSA